MSPFELNRVLENGCVGQLIESKSNKSKVGDYVRANLGWRELGMSRETDTDRNTISKIDSSIGPLQYFSNAWYYRYYCICRAF